MKTAHFYLLNALGFEARARLACRVMHKAYQQKLKIYCYCETYEQAELLNDLLWTFQDISFIPHCLVSDAQADKVPVYIGWPEQVPPSCEVFVNLSDTIPDFFKQYDRIVEVVCSEAAAKARARQSYKTYQGANYDLQTHEV